MVFYFMAATQCPQCSREVESTEADEEEATGGSVEKSTEATAEGEEAPTKSIYDLQPDDD